PIRIAAEMTVMTLGQTIAREEVEAGCGLMEKVLFKGRNLSEKARSIKRKRPKNAASRDIDCRMFQSVFERSGDRFALKKTRQTKVGARPDQSGPKGLQSKRRDL